VVFTLNSCRSPFSDEEYAGMFFVILGTMVLGDFAWWIFSYRRVHRRWLRVLVSLFALGQLLGLASIFVSRSELLQIEAYMPRWVHSMVLIWHIFLLLPWMVWQIALGASALAKWTARRFQQPPSPEQAVASLPGVSRRQFIRAAAVLTPPMLTGGGAVLGEQQLDDFRIRRLTVNLKDLPPALDGLTVAHVTDSHVGRFTRGRVLERIVEATNGLEADIVAITGDLINDSLRALPPALDMVRAMKARHLVVACEGNHDLIENPAIFRRDAVRGGLNLLRGEVDSINIRGHKVQALGLPWARHPAQMQKDMQSLLARRDPSAFSLLLAHHPDVWDLATGVPLTLAGHTHGGQIMWDDDTGFGPWMYKYWSGLYAKEGRGLVVSNGVGNWFPVRVHALAEIVHLTLRAGPSVA
jgi:uncharacterized protein